MLMLHYIPFFNAFQLHQLCFHDELSSKACVLTDDLLAIEVYQHVSLHGTGQRFQNSFLNTIEVESDIFTDYLACLLGLMVFIAIPI